MSQVLKPTSLVSRQIKRNGPIRVNGIGSESGPFVLEYFPAAKKATVWYFSEAELPHVDQEPSGGRVSAYSGTSLERLHEWLDERIGHAIIREWRNLGDDGKPAASGRPRRFAVGLSIGLTLLLVLVIAIMVRR